MKSDCDICMSAGSINRWGYCEVCGEEVEESASPVTWVNHPVVASGSMLQVIEGGAASRGELDPTEFDQATAS